MKYGMNMLLWTTHVTPEHYPILAQLKKVGWDGVEVPLFEGNSQHFQNLGKELDNLGLGRTAVTVVGEEASPISPDPKIRQAAVDRLRWAIDMTAAVGSQVLSGPFHSPLAVFTGQGPTADEKARAVEVLRQAAEAARIANVQLAIEYLNRFECYFLNTASDARLLADAVNHPNFGVMYDTFHAHIEEKNPTEAIAILGQRIVHVHISENDRGTPGTGQVRWDETFRALRKINYDRWLVIEAFGRALPALAAATKVWRDLFPQAEQVFTKGLSFMKEKVASNQ
jgi:D-psicose/D-tagatose/L-ribulose 3-epimerase